jgi:hypothetical protein
VNDVAKYAPLYIFIGAVLGAVIGAIAAYKVAIFNANAGRHNAKLQAHTAQQLKIAEFRQAWINSLRDAMAEFQSYGITPELDQTKERKFYEVGTRIELLMNPNDQDYNELNDALYGFLSAKDEFEKYSMNPEFISICQAILKREWEVTKIEIGKAFEENN